MTIFLVRTKYYNIKKVAKYLQNLKIRFPFWNEVYFYIWINQTGFAPVTTYCSQATSKNTEAEPSPHERHNLAIEITSFLCNERGHAFVEEFSLFT